MEFENVFVLLTLSGMLLLWWGLIDARRRIEILEEVIEHFLDEQIVAVSRELRKK